MGTASGFDVDVEVADIPFSAEVGEILAGGDLPSQKALETALTGGDDYQILFTVPESRVASFLEKAQETKIPVAALGTVRAGRGRVVVVGKDGRSLEFVSSSWRHF